MGRWRFLLSRRWVALTLAALVVAASCVMLGRWQWGRHVHRQAVNAAITANYEAAPVPIEELLATTDTRVTGDEQWRRVVVQGEYAADATVLVRNRPIEGTPAFLVLVPLELSAPADLAGTWLYIERGWTPVEDDGTTPAAVADPPDGSVTVTARLRTAETPAGREAPAGQVFAIDAPELLAASGAAGHPAFQDWAVLAEESPAPAVPLAAEPPPEVSFGNHLSYALQWWTFALAALVALVILARREATPRVAPKAHEIAAPETTSASDAGPVAEATTAFASAETARKRRRRTPTAEEEEDALIDAQLDDPSR